MLDRREEVTGLLNQAAAGDTGAIRRLVPLVYDELRALARHHRFEWRHDRSPGTLSLFHEAYLKLVEQSHVRWESRAQFFCIASQAMRSILIDSARYYARLKRGGDRQQVPLDEQALVSEERSDELPART